MNKILYVDDEIINLDLFKLSFKGKYNIITASSGYEGLRLLDSIKNIEIVISDMKMPGMNGLEFIQKAKEKYQRISYYMLSGYETTPQINTALNNNIIKSYFTKPFNKKEIELEIENCFNNKK